MKFILKTFEEIVEGFNNTKNKLIEKYSKSNIEELHQPRRHQIQFISKSIELIADQEEKEKILTSLILLQMCVIGRSSSLNILISMSEDIYRALDPSSATRAGVRASSYFNSLIENIGYSETNTFEPKDIIELLDVAKQFIQAQDYAYLEIQELKLYHYLKTAVLEAYESANKINTAIYESELKILANNEAKLKNVSLEKSKKETEKKTEILENESFMSQLSFFISSSPVILDDSLKQSTDIVLKQEDDSDSDSYYLLT